MGRINTLFVLLLYIIPVRYVTCNIIEDLMISVDGLHSSLETIKTKVDSIENEVKIVKKEVGKNDLILERLNNLDEEIKAVKKGNT